MNLIAKNRILDSIKKYPEAETMLLMWYKGFQSRQRTALSNRPGLTGYTSGMALLGKDEFVIKFYYHYDLNAGYIEFFGTPEDLNAYHKEEEAKYLAENPGEVIVHETIITSVIFSPPPPLEFQQRPEVYVQPPKEEFLNNTIAEINPEKIFSSKAEYNSALKRALDIFSASPGTPEFTELQLLLPSIKEYEDRNAALPELDFIKAIKLEMHKRGEIPLYLENVFGSEEEARLFLSGKKAVTKDILEALCARYKIDYLYWEFFSRLSL